MSWVDGEIFVHEQPDFKGAPAMNAPTTQQLNDPKWWDEVAPEGAEVYFFRGDWCSAGFYKGCPDNPQYWALDGWTDHCQNPYLTDRVSVERPTTPAWNGEGLPPVGCECEAYDHSECDWVVGRMLMHGNSDHAFASGTHDKWKKLFWACNFRPLRTPEQREREEAIDAALALDEYPRGESSGGILSRRDFCGKLYDAGMLHKGDK